MGVIEKLYVCFIQLRMPPVCRVLYIGDRSSYVMLLVK